MYSKILLCVITTVVMIACASVSMAVAIDDINGTFGAEWSAASLLGTLTYSDGTSVDGYFASDADYFYGAFNLVNAGTAKMPFANIYFYPPSSLTGDPYGNGNDVIIEVGNNRWGNSLDGSTTGVWMEIKGQLTDANCPIKAVYDSAGNPTVVEFAVKRTIPGEWSNYRMGGQIFNYSFKYLVADNAVPEPGSIVALVSGLAGLVVLRRRTR